MLTIRQLRIYQELPYFLKRKLFMGKNVNTQYFYQITIAQYILV